MKPNITKKDNASFSLSHNPCFNASCDNSKTEKILIKWNNKKIYFYFLFLFLSFEWYAASSLQPPTVIQAHIQQDDIFKKAFRLRIFLG